MGIIITGKVASRSKKENDNGDLIVKYRIDTGNKYETISHVNPSKDDIYPRDSEVSIEVRPSAWVSRNGAMISWYVAQEPKVEEF